MLLLASFFLQAIPQIIQHVTRCERLDTVLNLGYAYNFMRQPTHVQVNHISQMYLALHTRTHMYAVESYLTFYFITIAWRCTSYVYNCCCTTTF